MEREKVSLVFSCFDKCQLLYQIYPLCKENDSLVFNFHVWNLKQNSSNKMGLYEDYSSIDYSRNIVWVTTKTFQPNVYKKNHIIKHQIKYFEKEWHKLITPIKDCLLHLCMVWTKRIFPQTHHTIIHIHLFQNFKISSLRL